MATRSYLLLPATLAGMLAGGAIGAGVTAKASLPLVKQEVVTASYPNSNAVIAGIWTNVDAALCPAAEAALGLQAGECTIEPGTVLSLTRGATETAVSVSFSFAGTYVKGQPQ